MKLKKLGAYYAYCQSAIVYLVVVTQMTYLFVEQGATVDMILVGGFNICLGIRETAWSCWGWPPNVPWDIEKYP